MRYYSRVFQFILILITTYYNFKACKSQEYRLLNTTQPVEYDITIRTKIEKDNFSFKGKVIIHLIIQKSARPKTNTFQIHIPGEVLIEKPIIRQQLGNSRKNTTYITLTVSSYLIDKITGTMTGTTVEDMVQGKKYLLTLSYESKLRNDNVGFYTSSYMDLSTGEITWFAATNFNPTYARTAFPCYDEPKFKAYVTLNIIHPEDRYVISNTLRLSDKTHAEDKGMKISIFRSRNVLSTYQIAFVISYFRGFKVMKKQLDRYTDSKQEMRWFYQKGLENFWEDTATLGFKIYCDIYEELFGLRVRYQFNVTEQFLIPVSKIDNRPHWSLFTYQYESFCHNKYTFYDGHLYDMLLLIANQVLHQWFGNLITPEWWSYVWLSEGFATYYSYKVVNKVYSKQRIIGKFNIDILHRALFIDGDEFVQPMTFYVDDPVGILQRYDDITFKKSACIIGMIETVMGSFVFGHGLRHYLTMRQFKPVTEYSLFESLQLSIENTAPSWVFNITEAFQTWTQESGYPLVTIEVKAKLLKISQNRFNNDIDSCAFNTLWHIPISYEISGGKFTKVQPKFWIKTRVWEEPITWKKFDKSIHWVIANVQQKFYYRVNYNIENWNLIIETLNKNRAYIHVLNRAQLIDDAFNLALGGLLDYKILRNLAAYIEFEDNPEPVRAFLNGIEILQKGSWFLKNDI